MNADELHCKVRAAKDQMLALLRADGRVPYRGTAARSEYDRLSAEHGRLFDMWARADEAERRFA